MLRTETPLPVELLPHDEGTLFASWRSCPGDDSFGTLAVDRPPHLALALANDAQTAWAQRLVAKEHYLRSPVDPRCSVLAYIVLLGGYRIGCLIFGRPESTRVGDWYGDVEDKLAGRCRLSRWEVLNLARIYVSPAVQDGGAWCRPGIVPGFSDRHGLWHSCLTTRVILMSLECVPVDYLLAFPAVFLDQPYQIAEVLSYCDTTQPGHRGTVYREAGFRMERINEHELQTFAKPVRRLTQGEEAWVQYFATHSLRSKRYRSQSAAMRLAHQTALF